MTAIAGIPIPSTSPFFLAGVAAHVLLGLTCLVCGAIAMLSPKRAGRHPWFGTAYFWSLAGVFATASALAFVRWNEDRALFLLAVLAFALANLGRQAHRQRWRWWPRWHMASMSLSYIVLVTAFYVDNGKSLPVWRDMSVIAYWLAPSLLGLPILCLALLRHPLARETS